MDSPCDDNGQEVWTSQMIVAPAFVDAAAKDLATIGSAISRANAEALVPITALLPAGADDVSAAIAALFATHGQAYQELSAHAVAFHEQFVQLMSAGAAQYASAEAANSSPLQIVGQTALDAINSPVQTLTGRPLIGNGANGVAGTGQNGGDGGWLYGNGGNGGSGGTGQNGGNGGSAGPRCPAAIRPGRHCLLHRRAHRCRPCRRCRSAPLTRRLPRQPRGSCCRHRCRRCPTRCRRPRRAVPPDHWPRRRRRRPADAPAASGWARSPRSAGSAARWQSRRSHMNLHRR